MTRFSMAIVGLVALGVPRSTHAQRCRGCVGEDTVPHMRLSPAVGLHAGTPQKVSAAVGINVGAEWQRSGHDHARTIAAFVEPGLAAGRASIGYVDYGYGSFGSGFGVLGTFLRTWDDPWTAKPNTSYAGGEVLLWPILFVGPRIGVFRSVNGSSSLKHWFVSLDLGIGM